jgi:site-specific recombinase XerD
MATPESTFTTELQDWLADRSGLSESAVSAYRGEINRLAEFMTDLGIRSVRQMQADHWLAYLSALMQDRNTISSRRCSALKVTSALQAARITRSFLRHCFLRGWIGWVPLGPRRCKFEQLPRRASLPIEAINLLFGPAIGDEESARALCAISLGFWGAMKPREIAAAAVSDLAELGDGGAVLTVAGRPEPVLIPAAAMSHLAGYHALRRDAVGGDGGQGAPLISQLGSFAAVSAHRVWTLLRAWPPAAREGSEQIALGGRLLRDSFVALAAHAGISELAAVRLLTGRKSVANLSIAETPSITPQQLHRRVVDVLAEALADSPP